VNTPSAEILFIPFSVHVSGRRHRPKPWTPPEEIKN